MNNRFRITVSTGTAALSASAILLCVFLIGVLQLPFSQIGSMTMAEIFTRLLPIQIGSVLIPMIYCGAQTKPMQHLLQANVAVRFVSRLSWLIFVLKSNLLCAFLLAVALNSMVIIIILFAGSFSSAFIPQLLISFFAQFIFFFILYTLQQICFLLFHNWYASYFLTLLYAVFDFAALNIMPTPFYIGWGSALLVWFDGQAAGIIRLLVLGLCAVAMLSVIISRIDLLNYNKGTLQ